jgi:glycosyltransferase involved in cell wall biosynthesis
VTARDLGVERNEVLVPWGCTVIVPEIGAEGARTDGYRALVRAKIVRRFTMIVYDLIPITIRETAAVGMAEAFSSYLATVKLADRLSGISEATADGYAAFSSMLETQGLAGPVVAAHPLPSDVPLIDEAALERANLALERGPGPMVLVVGSHEPRKNHVSVLLAAERLWREGLEFHLVFIGGRGWRGERFEALVGELVGAGRPVQVVSQAGEELLWAAYRAARFSVFPSLAEGFGLPVAESLGSGTPVVTSNFGSMEEIARDGGALLVDPRSAEELARAMRSLLVDDELLLRLQAEARSRPGTSWDDYARDTWAHLTS